MPIKRISSRPLSPDAKRAATMVLLTVALCAPLLAWSTHRAAERAQSAAFADHTAITSQARRLVTLSASSGSDIGAGDVESISPGAGVDLVARLRAVMAEVGIGGTSLRDARQAEPVMLRDANAGLARLSGSATITSISPADAARLLSLWREKEPAWTVRSLALRASQTRSGPGQILDLFDLDLAFETIAPGGAAQTTNPPSPEARS
jgi:hypothetical protein